MSGQWHPLLAQDWHWSVEYLPEVRALADELTRALFCVSRSNDGARKDFEAALQLKENPTVM